MGNRVRVTARLIDTRSGAQEWAETYQREVADVFDLQSDLAQAIVAQLEAKILPSERREIENPMTRDLTAYDAFLRGRQLVEGYLDQADQKSALLKAVTYFEEAIVRDPAFALAFCYAAEAHDILFSNGLDASPARLRLAENALAAALRLQPNSPEAHLALADHYFRCYLDSNRAQVELELARPGLPNSPSFYMLSGNVSRRQGRWEEGENEFTKAVELDPRNPNAVNYLADTQVLRRRFPEAIQTYERAAQVGLDSPVLRIRIAVIKFAAQGDVTALENTLAAEPADLDVGGGETPLRVLVALIRNNPEGASKALAASPRIDFQDVDFSFYYPRSWYEALIARAVGNREQERTSLVAARSVLEERLKNKPHNRTRAVLAEVDAGLGSQELAIHEGLSALEAAPPSQDAYEAPLVKQALAQVYLLCGDKEHALQLVEELVRIPGYLSYGYLALDPAWAPLRAEPRFRALVTSLAEGAGVR
ncbi:MAG: tetratricopeptide repeat protein [Chthoniobacterales bacterium]